jgi:nitrate reductase molybdenum cofactor assembly chaperone NarJ/NarW
MNQDKRLVLQAASVLLQYPYDRLHAQLPVVTAAVESLPAGTPRARLAAFIGYVRRTAPTELERHYVETFDLRRRCCLYLTWWTDGETRRRGMALARLKDRYRARGLELASGELPDFLPVVLEFAAIGDLPDGLELLREHRAGVELLRLALVDAGTPYVAPVEAVCSLLPGPSPADRAAAMRLARSGPPREEVGLEPFTVTPDGGRR